LRSFTRDEEDIFFGRDEQVDAVLKKLRRTRFLPVVGPSGCGKSSLIRAGMMASLEGGLMDWAGAHWEMAEMRPGKHPFAALADALLSEEPFRERFEQGTPGVAERKASIGFLRAALHEGPLSLCEVLKRNRLPPRTNFLLLVDQFEEIFAARREGDADATDEFMALLLKSAEQRELPIYVVITMRTDYLGDCTVFHGLAEAINRSLFLTPRLTREQQGAAILRPAWLYKGDIDPELANHLLNEAGSSADQLPLLQHLLMRMWNLAAAEAGDSEGDQKIYLRFSHYKAAGGVEKALSQHAGEAYGELNPRQQEIAQGLFRAICELGPDGRERRRLVPLKTITELTGASETEVVEVSECFRRPGRNFLMPPMDRMLLATTNLDISHEALIRNWEQLRSWVREEAEWAEMYRELEKDARRHEKGVVGLRSTPNLEFTQQWREKAQPTAKWAQRYGGDFALAMAYLDKSQRSRDESVKAQQQVREHHLRELAEQERLRAEAEKERADAQQKRAEAEQALREELTKAQEQARLRSDKHFGRAQKRLGQQTNAKRFVSALQDLAAALRLDPQNLPAAALACELLTQKSWMPPVTAPLRPPTAVRAASFTPGGRSVVVVAEDGKLWRWSGRQFERPTAIELLPDMPAPLGGKLLTSAAFDETGGWLLVGYDAPSGNGTDCRLFKWSEETSSYLHQPVQISLQEPFRLIAWAADLKHLVALPVNFNENAYQVLRNQGDRFEDVTAEAGFGTVNAAAFLPGKGLLATATAQGEIRLWDAETLQRVSGAGFTLPKQGKAYLLRSGPGADDLSALVYQAPLRVLSLTGQPAKEISGPTATDLVVWFTFSQEEPGPRRLALTLNGRVEISDAASPGVALAEPLCFSGTVGFPVFSPDGRYVLIHSGQFWHTIDTVRVWDTKVIAAAHDCPEFHGEPAPFWLAELADIVTGAFSGEEGVDDELPAATLAQLRNSVAPQEITGEYVHVWRRIFPDSKLEEPSKTGGE
jgi:hypothetical protein